MDKRRSIAIFLAATAAYWASLYTYVPILSPYGQSLGASLGMVGLIVAAYGFSQLVLRIPTGILSDRLGVRRPFIWVGFAASTIAAIGMSAASTPLQLLIFRGFSGIAASMWVAFTVLFASYFRADQTSRSMSILLFCNQTAQLVATYAGGWMAQLGSWHTPYTAAIVLGLLGFVLTYFVTDLPLKREQTLSLASLLSIGKSPQLLAVSLLAALSQYVTFVTVYGFTPSYATIIGASKVQLGTLTLLSSIPTAMASLLGGTWFASRLGERRVVIGGFLIAGLSTLSIPFTPTVGMLYATQAIGGIGRGVVFPVLMAMSIQTVPPERKATAMGFFQSIYALGMTGGPAISGVLGNTMGMQGIFLSAGVVGCLAGLAAWFVFSYLSSGAQKQHSPAQNT